MPDLNDALLQMYRELTGRTDARIGEVIEYFKQRGYEIEDLIKPESPFNLMRAHEIRTDLRHLTGLIENLFSRIERLEQWCEILARPRQEGMTFPYVDSNDDSIRIEQQSEGTGVDYSLAKLMGLEVTDVAMDEEVITNGSNTNPVDEPT